MKVFKSANFTPWATFDARCFVMKNENKEVCFQNIPNFGTFMEIEEFDYMKDMTSEQKIEELEKFADSLGLNKSQSSNIKKLELYVERVLKNQSKEL